jgi:hypothetical protein
MTQALRVSTPRFRLCAALFAQTRRLGYRKGVRRNTTLESERLQDRPRMPLDRLAPERRTAVAELRMWYHETFLVPRTSLRGENGSDGEGPNQ